MVTWEDWLEVAKSDLAAARNLGQAGFYPQACFNCQQCVEKALKAVLLKKTDEFPKVHSLRELADAAGLFAQLKEFIAVIEVDYTATRYLDVGATDVRKSYGREKFARHFAAAEKALELIVKWKEI